MVTSNNDAYVRRAIDLMQNDVEAMLLNADAELRVRRTLMRVAREASSAAVQTVAQSFVKLMREQYDKHGANVELWP